MDWPSIALHKVRKWELTTVLETFVYMLKVKVVGHVEHQDLDIRVGEGLSKADAHSTTEWTEAAYVALFAAWSEAELAVAIKALWDELEGALPLVLIHVKPVNVVCNHITFLELIVSKLAIG